MSERVLEPLEMTDTEILDWMNEYSDNVNLSPIGGWFAHADREAYWGSDVRNAVRIAAAYHKEANRDF